MGYWNSRGLRGSAFEEIINFTNEAYRKNGLAVVQKIPTPITPVKLDESKRITLAYFDKQSTVDYMCVAQGIAICFDAKETGQKSLPIQNIHRHQIEFMEDFNRQNGAAFLLVHFSLYGEYYFLPVEVLKKYYDGAENGGRKSIPYSAFEKRYEVFIEKNSIINYLEALNTYLINKNLSDD